MTFLDRETYIKLISRLYDENPEASDIIEDILVKYGASEDDSDPEEGLFSTMSYYDLFNAYNELSDKLQERSNPENYYNKLVKQSKLNSYEQGFVDGYEACRDGILH